VLGLSVAMQVAWTPLEGWEVTCLTLVVVSGLAWQHHADGECSQNLSAVLSAGCCTQRLGLFVKSPAVVLLSCGSRPANSDCPHGFTDGACVSGAAVTGFSSGRLDLLG